MVEQQHVTLDRVFHALSDRTRRAMLQRLTEGEKTVSDLAAPHAMSLAGASKHIRVLEGAGLVRRRIEGRVHFCRLEAERLKQADNWLKHYERFWNERLDALETLLREEDEQANGGASR
ncbi:ArsR/SmtB family transcription factor [Tianweitania sediminis]|jgi:DNA-binding transcriptional ArsR family regulator|uniref:Winged helix-turn-helix transcriptional regulator n=1 Tax=Tianweitania sediminis TaxID=1502156 RepID=A0A8J7UJC5_9HYPH|nr:metalloregulator ArsR/SmtB family transcription factor [Tianweitania sediminis]MBP0441139.1 winged helix-turn-helix transcriptional regulator [Tianweitania sediminis]HEV7416266.1 metalloregulator ArsR/SmtB family transcription factor [Tianweitania sediminis]